MEINLPFGYILRMPTPNGQESPRYSSPVFPTSPGDSFTASPTPPVRDSFTESPPLTVDEIGALFDELENGPTTPLHSSVKALSESPMRASDFSSEAPFETISPHEMHVNPFQLERPAYDPIAHEVEGVNLPGWTGTPAKSESDKAELPAITKVPEKKRSNRQGMVYERIAVINDYKNGEKNRAKLAKKHGVKPHTVGSWVRRFEERPDTPFFKTDAELQATEKADRKTLKDQPAPDSPKTESSPKRTRSPEEDGGLEITVPFPKRPTALKHVLGMDWEDWIVSDHV